MNDQHTFSPPRDAIPFSDAMKQYLPAEMWDEYARATKARKNVPRAPNYFSGPAHIDLGPTIKHIHHLLNVARNNQYNAWHDILAAMKAKLEVGELRAFGQDNPPCDPWRAIPAAAWRNLRITNVETGKARVGPKEIYNIYVLPPGADDHMPTGTPGRPTMGIDIIRVEFYRREAANKLEASLAAECRALAAWYSLTYPGRHGPKTKTVENNIRPDYRAAKARLA